MTFKNTPSKTKLFSTLFALSVMVFTMAFSNKLSAENSEDEVTVYKSPTCGCCSKWVEHLEQNGFKVTAIDTSELRTIKEQLGIAPNLQSCHTAKIGNYFVEGHVPAKDIKTMLLTKPDIEGITVPGMPMGSPGMEGSRVDKYDVIAVNKDKTTSVFSSH